jgi:hypothetical protein
MVRLKVYAVYLFYTIIADFQAGTSHCLFFKRFLKDKIILS